jgi:hypothetical protein
MNKSKKHITKKKALVKKIQNNSISVEDLELNNTDKKVLEFKLKYPELRDKEIANMLHISGEWICKIQKKPAYIKAYAYYTSETLSIIKETKAEAARTLKSLLRAKSEMVRFWAAKAFIENELNLENSDDVPEFIIQDEWK